VASPRHSAEDYIVPIPGAKRQRPRRSTTRAPGKIAGPRYPEWMMAAIDRGIAHLS
jgi:hypothetical protein